jgi:hypothetical protein
MEPWIFIIYTLPHGNLTPMAEEMGVRKPSKRRSLSHSLPFQPV